MLPGESGTLLVIASHALDEVLGCGGLMVLARDRSMCVEVAVVFGDGTGHDAGRRDAVRAACGILGHNPPVFLGQPENRGDTLPLGEIVPPLEKLISETGATLVFVPFGNSLHVDHTKTY